MRLEYIDQINDMIVKAFHPDPIKCQINGKTYLIERWSDGWMWRNEDGDGQQDWDIEPFATACECQQSAIHWAQVNEATKRQSSGRNRQCVECLLFQRFNHNL